MSASVYRSLMPRACEVCRRRDGLLRCTACQAVYYCGGDHQAADRPGHKRDCAAVRNTRATLEHEERELRESPGDIFTHGDVFENYVGRFWGIWTTRPYMRARVALVEQLMERFGFVGGRADVVRMGLDHLLDMMRLCRSDNMGLRDIIPPLYIRLGRDQEAYDFMKWYATMGMDSSYDWGDMSLPFLNVKDADALESPEGSFGSEDFDQLSHDTAVTLIKIRALVDLQAIQNTLRSFKKTLPPEIVDHICRFLSGGVIDSRHRQMPAAGTWEMTRLIETLKGQIWYIFRFVEGCNPHFFPTLLNDPWAALATKPGSYSLGQPEHAYEVLRHGFAAWAESPGALQVARALWQTARK